MTDNYYKDELLYMVESWTDEEIQTYIRSLEQRIRMTKEHMQILRALIRRRSRNKNLKDSGPRGGI